MNLEASQDLSALFAEITATLPPSTLTPAQQAHAARSALRSQSTARNRKVRKDAHTRLIEEVGGDREKLKTITVWAPRQTKMKLFARGFNREEFAKGGDKFTDMEAEIATVEYDLLEIEVERAKPPKEEVAIAQLEGRFQTHTPSIQGFFAPSRPVKYAAPVESYAPLGDFEWTERDEVVERMNAMTRRAATRRAKEPIRNVKEANR